MVIEIVDPTPTYPQPAQKPRDQKARSIDGMDDYVALK
ncbi:hypothetical protein DT23_17240 [Thioclava indica]|uniref:Uncharacterized protein n=1 Tax=Thioclava indica TaxID=1353528 RepID=A0A074JNH2_9RHOB|nr:hypothetical protein DT23_17240 [Thioclava indica]